MKSIKYIYWVCIGLKTMGIFSSFKEDKKMKVFQMKYFVSALFLCMITGCSLSYTIHDPQVSSFQYDSVPSKKLVIKVVDQRKDLVFQRQISNLRNVKITLINVEDPIKWFANALEKELIARGISVEVIANGQPVTADMTLTVKTYQIVSHRMTGFSPWETYHLQELTLLISEFYRLI